MLDLDRQLSEFGSFVDEAVEPVRAIEITDRAAIPATNARRRQLVGAGAAAAIIVLVIAAVAILDPFGSGTPFIDEPTTIPVTTTLVTPTTEASEATVTPSTSTPTASVEPPVISWTRIDDPAVFGGPLHESMTAVASGPTGLIAVGPDWVEPTSTDAAVWTSTDGMAWTRFSDDQGIFGGDGFQYPTAVAVGLGNIVISGYDCANGPDSPHGCAGAVWTSKDALTWQRVGTDAEVFEGEGIFRILDVIATDSGFVAVGSAVWASPNGDDWERIFDLTPTMGTNTPGEVMVSVVQKGDGYVAAGQRGFQAAVWTSTDGRDWSAVEDEGQFGPASVPQDQVPTSFSFHAINDLVNSGDAILGVGSGTGTQPDSPIVWRSTDGADWEQIVVDRFSAHRSEIMNTVIRTDDDWILAAGTHHAVRHEHSALLLWVSTDNGRSWSVLPSQGDVLGNYLSDLYRSDVNDMILWNDRIVMVGSRGTGREEVSTGVNLVHETWDAVVWIGTIQD